MEVAHKGTRDHSVNSTPAEQDNDQNLKESAPEVEKQVPLHIRKAEVYSRQYGLTGKIVLYFAIFLVAYAYRLDNVTRRVYQATATNSYKSHSLLSTITVVRSVIGAAGMPVYARLSDIFGRTELLIVAILFYVVGTVIETQAYDVQRFAGGAVLFQVGLMGLSLMLELIIMDNSFMNWRMVASFVPALPVIINTWISGNITEAMGDQWSWGMGMWAIILPVTALPLIICMYHMQWRARKSGDMQVLDMELTDRRRLGTKAFLLDIFWKLDPVGVLLLVAVLALILTPLTIAGGTTSTWSEARIIAPICIGVACIPVLIFWERYTQYPILPFHLLKDRTVAACLIIGIFNNWVYAMQGEYMYTVLLVAVGDSIASATRITSLYTFVATISGTIFGLFLVKLRYPKPFVIAGTILWTIAMGMLTHFRGQLSSKPGIIGGLVVMGLGGGLFPHTVQAMIQSRARHEHMAIITSVYLATYQMGTAIGSSVAGAIWTQLLPDQLNEHLQNSTLVSQAYGSPFTFIRSYPVGTPERAAVRVSYEYVQQILCATGTGLCGVLIIAALVMHNPRFESRQAMSDAEENYSNEREHIGERKTWWKRGPFF